MTTTKSATGTRLRSFKWTGNSLTLVEGSDDDSVVIANMVTYEDVIAALSAGTLEDGEIPVAGAVACALAARALLRETAHDYYSRLLHVARAVERALPDDAELTDTLKRVLAAGDEANGPANGPEGVAAAMTAEAVRISHLPARRKKGKRGGG